MLPSRYQIAMSALPVVSVIAAAIGLAPASAVAAPPASSFQVVAIEDDTLSALALQHSVDVDSLLHWNSISNADLIHPGAIILVAPPVAIPNTPVQPAAPQAQPATLEELHDMAVAEVQRYGLPPGLLGAIIDVESTWDPAAVSSVGAIGLGQLMPDTAAWIAEVIGDPTLDPWDPADNLRMSAWYLRWLLDQFNADLNSAIMAYYQGLGALREFGPYSDTYTYLAKVTANIERRVGSTTSP